MFSHGNREGSEHELKRQMGGDIALPSSLSNGSEQVYNARSSPCKVEVGSGSSA